MDNILFLPSMLFSGSKRIYHTNENFRFLELDAYLRFSVARDVRARGDEESTLAILSMKAQRRGLRSKKKKRRKKSIAFLTRAAQLAE